MKPSNLERTLTTMEKLRDRAMTLAALVATNAASPKVRQLTRYILKVGEAHRRWIKQH